MKAAPAMAAFCIFLALSISHCSALVHTAELLPVGHLLRIDKASPGRHLLKASSRLVEDLEDEIEQEEVTISAFADEIEEEEMTAMELEEVEDEMMAAEEEDKDMLAEAEAETDEALSLDTERLTKERKGLGSFLGVSNSSWPRFGLVGEKQAALYYGVCLLFTVFFFKNSGIRQSLMGITRNNSHGKSARLGA